MSIGTTGAIIAGSLAAGGGIFNSIVGASAAKTASQQQVAGQQAAIAEQRRQFDTTQQNFAPFLSAGTSSLADLMKAFQGGQFGPGSTGPAPQFTGGSFMPPTLQQAEQNPGYQFALQQGEKGINQAAASTGGAISGGTLRAADQFANGLATTNYQQVFNNALSTYGTGLDAYKAQLAGYGAGLAGQQQQFQQLLAPIQIGVGAADKIGQFGANASSNIGQLIQGIGTSQAAGTVGAADATRSGVSNIGNLGLQAILFKGLFGPGGSGGGGVQGAPDWFNPASVLPGAP